MSKLNYLYLGLGSNLGEKLENIHLAYTKIQNKVGDICAKSFVYETPPWGFESKDVFFNSVILVETQLTPFEVLEQIKLIETEMGRGTAYQVGYSSRLIDIDILDYNNQIIETKLLVIPHPHIEKRNFVLYPLRDVKENWIHPKSLIAIQDLLEKSENIGEIKRVLF